MELEEEEEEDCSRDDSEDPREVGVVVRRVMLRVEEGASGVEVGR